MVGTINYWNLERQFGFVVTETGQEFYLGAAGLTGRANIVGTRVRFDRAKTDDSWTEKLNDGMLRDTPGIDLRNPRRPRSPWVKPAAMNVVVIEDEQ